MSFSVPVVGSTWLSMPVNLPVSATVIAVIAEHVDAQRALGRGRVDPHDLLLRQAELHRDRLQLGDDDEARGVGGVDDVALIDLPQAGAARQRRNDLGVAEHGLRVVDRSLVGIHQRFLLGDHRALGIGLLLRAGIGGGQLLIANQIEALIGEQRLVLGLLGDGLIVASPCRSLDRSRRARRLS